MICTSPLSSMALTAMLGLSGLPMGIAAIACVGGSFTNGIIFARLKAWRQEQGRGCHAGASDSGGHCPPPTRSRSTAPISLEAGWQAFSRGRFPTSSTMRLGTASPIPGTVSAPFAFNPPLQVILALAFGHRRRFPGRLCRQPDVQTPQETGISFSALLKIS